MPSARTASTLRVTARPNSAALPDMRWNRSLSFFTRVAFRTLIVAENATIIRA